MREREKTTAGEDHRPSEGNDTTVGCKTHLLGLFLSTRSGLARLRRLNTGEGKTGQSNSFPRSSFRVFVGKKRERDWAAADRRLFRVEKKKKKKGKRGSEAANVRLCPAEREHVPV